MKRFKPFLALLILLGALAGLLTAALHAAALDITTYVLSAPADNSAPVAKNIAFNTFRDISIAGQLDAIDPDGDAFAFTVVSGPKKGSVTVDRDGSFTYSPDSGKKGTDSFTYIATDEAGNTSSPARVTVSIQKQKTDVMYSDMQDDPDHYAALVLAERGVFTGRQIAGCYFFCPDETVTRSEFLAMCMGITGDPLLTGVTATGFFDDDQIDPWAKPYVSTALMEGSLRGLRNEQGFLVFNAGDDITWSEAAVMLNDAFHVTDVVSAAAVDGQSSPALQAAENLKACGIIGDTSVAGNTQPLTRAEAAVMLTAAMENLER